MHISSHLHSHKPCAFQHNKTANTKFALVLILIYSTSTLHFNGSFLPQKLQRLVQYVYVKYKMHFTQ